MKRVAIDTVCGVDDAVAIMIALSHSQLEVLGVSTVNGNIGIQQDGKTSPRHAPAGIHLH